MRKAVIVLTACLALSGISYGQSKDFRLARWMQIQSSIIKELDKSYVDTLPVSKMEKAAINAMLKELDPYTIYVPEDEVEDFTLQIGGVYVGIGAIIYKPENDNVYINEPYAGSPCVKAGMESGDQILRINGEDVTPLTSAQCSEKMKGQPGTIVEFLVKKVNTSDTLKVKVRREKIYLPDIQYAGMIEPKTGYICQTGFTEGVAEQMRTMVAQLKAQGMTKLVLDLRGNGGGLMKEAIDIVSIFVPKNSLVVTSRGRDGQNAEVYRTDKDALDEKLELVVLVDGGSASSSEIVSGALQDLDRATIIGTRTFGKGLVQNVRPLPFGGQLKITVAKYYTPSGRCVQAIDYSHRNPDGSVGHIPDSLTHVFKTLKGREVRDGGGITPDIVIEGPEYDDVIYSLVLSGIVGQYALHYKMSHPTIAPEGEFDFIEFDDFVEYVLPFVKDNAKESVKNINHEQIKPFIEEEIVTRYYYQEAGVKHRLQYDTQLKEALTKKSVL